MFCVIRRSYISAHVLLNSLNEFGNKDKRQGLPSIYFFFFYEFYKIQ